MEEEVGEEDLRVTHRETHRRQKSNWSRHGGESEREGERFAVERTERRWLVSEREVRRFGFGLRAWNI